MPELRLLGCVEVDRVFALPLQKDTDLVAVPLNAKIKLQRAKNMEQLDNFMEFSRFLEKAKRLMMDARDRLQVVDLKYSEKETKKSERGLGLFHSHTSHHLSGSNATKSSKFITSSPQMTTNQLIASLENGFVLRKSASCDSTSKYMQSQSHHSSLGSIADEYDEIDQIYDYVRGFAPLPKSVSTRSMGLVSEAIPEHSHSHSHGSHHPMGSNTNTNSKSSQISKSHIDNSGNYSSVLNTVPNSSGSNNNSLEKRMAANNNNSNGHHHHHHHHHHYSHHQNGSGEAEKPIPPPIETIPSKKVPEKRQRPTLPKLYVKNVINHHHKATPVIIPTNGKDLLEPQSPLFHIRWVGRNCFCGTYLML